jgi:hypothetical protein
VSGRNGRVRVDKEKHIAPRYADAGIPHRCDVTIMDRQDDRARLPAYLSRSISGSVIHHDDFE